MVSGLTPPSNRKDINDSNKNTESLRDVMPFIPDSRNAQVGSSLFGQAPLSVPNISGQFSITPYEAVESVLLKLVKSSANEFELNLGDEVESSIGGSNKWKGKMVWIEEEKLGTSGSDDTKTYLFEPTTNNSFTDSNQTLTMTTTAEDPRNKNFNDAGTPVSITFSYTSGNVTTGGIALNTSSIIAKRYDPSDNDVEIKEFYGVISNGAIITVRPYNEKTLTLKTGGNIDIENDVQIEDNSFAILQFFDDVNETNVGDKDGGYFVLVSGGSGISSGSSTSIKEPCRVATTGNNLVPTAIGSTVDGVTIVVGDRVLYKNQTTQKDNGIYVCTNIALTVATMERASDFDNNSEVKSGVLVGVLEGTENGDTLWSLTSDGGLTVGTSSLVFTRVTIDQSLDFTWSGKHLYNNATTWLGNWDTDAEKQAGCQVKFQGDGLRHQTYNSGTGLWDWDSGYSDASTQRVLEIGKYGSHEVKIIAEVTGEGDAIITDPDGSGSYTIPNSDPSISFKSSLVMNTYTMYDLDTLVFSQGASTTTPPPLDSWVYIEANTGTSGSPNLTGMHYNVPTSKTHQFKVNGTEKLNISSDGIKLLGNSTPSSLSNGMMWLNSSDNKVYVRSNGATSELGSGGVALDDDPIWSGKHVWDTDSTWLGSYDTDSEKATNCHAKFQGDGLRHQTYNSGTGEWDWDSGYSDDSTQRVLEIGKYGSHEVKIIAEVTGEGNAIITDPDGSGSYTIPNSDPSISFKSSLVMNTYTMYDLDTLVFSQGASTTTPPPENDWVWIEANTGTSGSPNLTGMHYNVPSSKTHQFKINGTEVFAINNDKIEFSSGQEISHDSGGLTFNVPTGDKHYWQVNDHTKIYFDTDQLYLANGTSLKINDNYVEFGDLSSSPTNPSSNRARLFLNASDVLTIRKSDGTEVNLESSGGVALGDSPTWTGVHTFQNHVNIGNNYSQDNLTITSKIKGSTIPVDTNWGDNSQDNIDDTLFIDANLDMNTWNIYDLDSLYFSTNASSTNQAHETDYYSIDTIDTSTNESLNFYTKSGKDFKWYEGGVSSEVLKYDGGDNEWRFMHVINMNNNKIENVADPVANKDVVNKQYADANYSGGGGGIQRYQLYNTTSSESEWEMWHCPSHSFGGSHDFTYRTLVQNKIYYQPFMVPVACKLEYAGLWAESGNSVNNDKYDVGIYSNGGSGNDSGLLYPYQRLEQKTDVRSYNLGFWGITLKGDWNYSLDAGLYWLAVLPIGNDVGCVNIKHQSMQPVGHWFEDTGDKDDPTTMGATVGYYDNSESSLPSQADDNMFRLTATSPSLSFSPAIFCRLKSA